MEYKRPTKIQAGVISIEFIRTSLGQKDRIAVGFNSSSSICSSHSYSKNSMSGRTNVLQNQNNGQYTSWSAQGK
jgi:hypothetical protein